MSEDELEITMSPSDYEQWNDERRQMLAAVTRMAPVYNQMVRELVDRRRTHCYVEKIPYSPDEVRLDHWGDDYMKLRFPQLVTMEIPIRVLLAKSWRAAARNFARERVTRRYRRQANERRAQTRRDRERYEELKRRFGDG